MDSGIGRGETRGAGHSARPAPWHHDAHGDIRCTPHIPDRCRRGSARPGSGSRARILDAGVPARWGSLPTRELPRLTLAIASADPDDPVIARHGDPVWLAWMRANCRSSRGSRSWAAQALRTRLRNWSHTGRDQVAWLVDRLRADPSARDATITTFQPPTDETYVPCVSLIDAWAPDGALELIVYAHSLDFGKKAYGDLVRVRRAPA